MLSNSNEYSGLISFRIVKYNKKYFIIFLKYKSILFL